MATPDEELASAVATLEEWRSLNRRLDTARARLDESSATAAEALERAAVEVADVQKLESLSFTKILAHLKGSHSDDLARETAERDAAEYQYLTLKARVDADQRVVDGFTSQLAALGDVRRRYEQALLAKEQWLWERNDPAAARLYEIAEQSGRLQAQLVQIREATDAGKSALESLRTGAKLLGSARSWSTFDTCFDGGVLTSLIKHDKLDGVVAHLRLADATLKLFTTELADIHTAGVQLLELDSFTKVFDVWFDNLFTDLEVQSRIDDAQKKVANAIGGVEKLLRQMTDRAERCEADAARLRGERTQLLLG